MQTHAVAPTVAPTFCICMFICVCICVCIFICVCACICVCICVCICIFIWLSHKLHPFDKLPHVHLLAWVDYKKVQKPNPWILELGPANECVLLKSVPMFTWIYDFAVGHMGRRAMAGYNGRPCTSNWSLPRDTYFCLL